MSVEPNSAYWAEQLVTQLPRPQDQPRHTPLLLYGILCFSVGLLAYLTGVLLVFPRYLLGLHAQLDPIAELLVWYSGMPIVLGLGLALVDLLVFLTRKKPAVPVRYDPVQTRKVTVALTAYNDEESITEAVEDFLSHPLVARVIVVSNNSSDATFPRAEAAGAITINEEAPGYGRCVYRCLREAVRYTDTDYVVLCEGDRTFRAYDVEKLLAYAPHADIVNGTRIVEPLRHYVTQLSTFMYYGNLFVGKLLEAKHLGRSTITDVGTTYKLCRRDSLMRLLPRLDPAVNLEFNAHFLDTALGTGQVLLECPITFHPRVGVSKGGNVNNWRGFTVGTRMIMGLVFGWKRLA
ncbi:glycosyltransferase [Sphingomonas hankyongi]|uniref:Glycosyltransferase n=1 Tax=Sphingomonas hankyongi TaxID=2908209 RepID=A0ABT0S4K4_9SPHN|nr:glycosyltransferase [Sphingomonas hankyongi]MCL6730793.1 glycosyltransferase [Sphingomonas hankyongi]